MCGHTRDPIIYSKFYRNPFRGFGAQGGQNLAFPITLASRFYNSLYYRTSRDYSHMPIGKVWIYRLLFVCFCLSVCTATDFSAEGRPKASGVRFCTAVHRRSRQGISRFGELCSPEAQNRTNRLGRIARVAGQPWRGRRGRAHWPRV